MKPPGPPFIPIIGHLPAFRRDVLGLLSQSVRDHGDIVRFKLGPRDVFLVNHPDDIVQILKKNAKNYDKDTRSTRFLSDICGESLLTSNGEEWQRRRRILQPAFHHRVIEGFAAAMQAETDALVTRIRPRDQFDASSAMMHTTFRIVTRALFGADLPESTVVALEAPIARVLSATFARFGTLMGLKSRRFKSAMREIDSLVTGILSSLPDDEQAPNLLTMMRAGEYDDTELRNESINFLIAGHETTANALTWLFAHLAGNLEEQSRCASDPDALDRALQETLRLSPPIWIIERHAIDDDEVAGYRIPAGAPVFICTYTVHRHRDFWENSDTFDPDRFLSPPPAAYLPFGLGPRVCIGQEFALMEAKIIASKLLSQFEFSPFSNTAAEPEPAITLRVRGGLTLKIRPRAGS
ncbi:MAG: cytochrome P450 [Pseudoalteromonas tetraodonis]|jgi:cytochrome P450